jgi:ElaB/YqjD/DUF883 family membrane-anchored ribosome-binding protein
MATPTPKDIDLGRIESEIAVVREDVGRTVQEIGSRLTPARLMEEAKQTLKDSTRDTTRAVAQSASDAAATVAAQTRAAALDARDHVRAHPYAAGAVAAGLGLGYVLMSMSMRNRRRLVPREWDEPFDRSSRRSARGHASHGSAYRALPLAATAAVAFLLWRDRM